MRTELIQVVILKVNLSDVYFQWAVSLQVVHLMLQPLCVLAVCQEFAKLGSGKRRPSHEVLEGREVNVRAHWGDRDWCEA